MRCGNLQASWCPQGTANASERSAQARSEPMSSQDPLLEARLQREAQFHDAKYGGADLYPRHYAARPTQYVYAQLRACLGDLHGKRVLEYGCGEGWITRELARMGGQGVAFDSSPQAGSITRGLQATVGRLSIC